MQLNGNFIGRTNRLVDSGKWIEQKWYEDDQANYFYMMYPHRLGQDFRVYYYYYLAIYGNGIMYN